MKQRLRLTITGKVQGVGFRPFVYRLAKKYGLTGWVANSSSGVTIEVEGLKNTLDTFLFSLENEQPPQASIHTLEPTFLDCVLYHDFVINKSINSDTTAIILADIATCPDCRKEIFDPANRRYLYPFTNCTNCGPRYSIIEKLPYDRMNTTMAGFTMCDNCLAEYNNPENRRFHAQPNACSVCGPVLEFYNHDHECIASSEEAMAQAITAIKQGKIVAIKGLGGFHLICDARNDQALINLRQRKVRAEKPFAVMMSDIHQVKNYCSISLYEERLLLSSQSPIVLLEKIKSGNLSEWVAPENPTLGVMIAYTPLHCILLSQLTFPVVATSGNVSDEPIAINTAEAFTNLHKIADFFLTHNRPIKRPVDDSITRIILDRELILRRARGYAPLPIQVQGLKNNILGVGAYLKNTISLSKGDYIVSSQYLGDLETQKCRDLFETTINDLTSMYDIKPDTIACDLHPDIYSTRFANSKSVTIIPVQHHTAHVLSCLAENEITPPVLGVAWDGTGFGEDGTIWGGECIEITEDTIKRVACFSPFHLIGGEQAIYEPRRIALSLLYQAFGSEFIFNSSLKVLSEFNHIQLQNMITMIQKSINSPQVSSVGRLFDGVSALLGICSKITYDGQAAMSLEYCLKGTPCSKSYPVDITLNNELRIINTLSIIRAIVTDIEDECAVETISAKFHNTLVSIIVSLAESMDTRQVALSGGCFQNKYLVEHMYKSLTEKNIKCYTHQRIPPNDSGISLGQVYGASLKLKKGKRN